MFNNSQNLKIFAYAVVFSVSTDPCIHYDCDINNLYHYYPRVGVSSEGIAVVLCVSVCVCVCV